MTEKWLSKKVSETVEALKGTELTEEELFKLMYENEKIYQIVLSDLSKEEKAKLINSELLKVTMVKEWAQENFENTGELLEAYFKYFNHLIIELKSEIRDPLIGSMIYKCKEIRRLQKDIGLFCFSIPGVVPLRPKDFYHNFNEISLYCQCILQRNNQNREKVQKIRRMAEYFAKIFYTDDSHVED